MNRDQKNHIQALKNLDKIVFINIDDTERGAKLDNQSSKAPAKSGNDKAEKLS